MNSLERTLQKYYKISLAALFIIAVFLRWLYLPQKAISFAYDQARDAFIVQELIHGNLKILGPPVSGVPGLFHGVLYYYVIAPAYLFGGGNPVIVAYFLSLISSISVLSVFYLTYLLTKRYTPSLIAGALFAFSFEATQYANLLTNASMGLWFVPIIYIGLYLWITEKSKWGMVITGIFFGLAIQSEVALSYHLIPILFWLFIKRRKITKKQILMFLASLFIAVSPMLIAEVKFGFTGFKGIIYLLSGQDGIAQNRTFLEIITIYISQVTQTFRNNIIPVNQAFAGLITVAGLCYVFLKEKTNLASVPWYLFAGSIFLSHLIALPFGGTNMKHIMVGAASGICVFTGIFLWKYLKSYKYILAVFLILIIGADLKNILKENINGQTIFPLQQDLVLSKEISLIDYTYTQSNGSPFSISSLTSPLFVNTLWSYLYNWHGKSKYGYLPTWTGRDQIGQLGNNLSFATGKETKHFFIIEPTFGIPDLYITYARGDQDSVSNVIAQKTYGDLIVEERIANNAK